MDAQEAKIDQKETFTSVANQRQIFGINTSKLQAKATKQNCPRHKFGDKIPKLIRNHQITVPRVDGRRDSSGDSRAESSNNVTTRKREIPGDKLKPSHIPRRKQSSSKGDSLKKTDPTPKKKDFTNPCVSQNVQRIHLLINQDYRGEENEVPNSVAKTRPIPQLGEIYPRGSMRDTEMLQDWFAHLDTPANSTTTDHFEFRSDLGSSHPCRDTSRETGSKQLQNETVVIIPGTKCSPRVPKNRQENENSYLTVEYPTKDIEFGYGNTQDYNMRLNINANKTHSKLNIGKMATDKSGNMSQGISDQTHEHYQVTNKLSQSALLIRDDPNVKKQETNDNKEKTTDNKPTRSKNSHLTKQANYEPITDRRKSFSNAADPRPDEYETSLADNGGHAISCADCLSEILQKTTNFEEDKASITQTSTAETDIELREDLSSRYTLSCGRDGSMYHCHSHVDWGRSREYDKNLASGSSSIADSMRCNFPDDIDDYDTFKAAGCDSYRSLFRRYRRNSHDYCKRCHRFKTPYCYKHKKCMPKSTSSFRHHLSTYLFRRRFNKVWKKSTDRWAFWANKNPYSHRKMHIMDYLQRATLWEDANIQTNIFVYAETGTNSSYKDFKSFGASSIFKKNNDVCNRSTSDLISPVCSSNSRRIRIGPSLYLHSSMKSMKRHKEKRKANASQAKDTKCDKTPIVNNSSNINNVDNSVSIQTANSLYKRDKGHTANKSVMDETESLIEISEIAVEDKITGTDDKAQAMKDSKTSTILSLDATFLGNCSQNAYTEMQIVATAEDIPKRIKNAFADSSRKNCRKFVDECLKYTNENDDLASLQTATTDTFLNKVNKSVDGVRFKQISFKDCNDQASPGAHYFDNKCMSTLDVKTSCKTGSSHIKQLCNTGITTSDLFGPKTNAECSTTPIQVCKCRTYDTRSQGTGNHISSTNYISTASSVPYYVNIDTEPSGVKFTTDIGTYTNVSFTDTANETENVTPQRLSANTYTSVEQCHKYVEQSQRVCKAIINDDPAFGFNPDDSYLKSRRDALIIGQSRLISVRTFSLTHDLSTQTDTNTNINMEFPTVPLAIPEYNCSASVFTSKFSAAKNSRPCPPMADIYSNDTTIKAGDFSLPQSKDTSMLQVDSKTKETASSNKNMTAAQWIKSCIQKGYKSLHEVQDAINIKKMPVIPSGLNESNLRFGIDKLAEDHVITDGQFIPNYESSVDQQCKTIEEYPMIGGEVIEEANTFDNQRKSCDTRTASRIGSNINKQNPAVFNDALTYDQVPLLIPYARSHQEEDQRVTQSTPTQSLCSKKQNPIATSKIKVSCQNVQNKSIKSVCSRRESNAQRSNQSPAKSRSYIKRSSVYSNSKQEDNRIIINPKSRLQVNLEKKSSKISNTSKHSGTPIIKLPDSKSVKSSRMAHDDIQGPQPISQAKFSGYHNQCSLPLTYQTVPKHSEDHRWKRPILVSSTLREKSQSNQYPKTSEITITNGNVIPLATEELRSNTKMIKPFIISQYDVNEGEIATTISIKQSSASKRSDGQKSTTKSIRGVKLEEFTGKQSPVKVDGPISYFQGSSTHKQSENPNMNDSKSNKSGRIVEQIEEFRGVGGVTIKSKLEANNSMHTTVQRTPSKHMSVQNQSSCMSVKLQEDTSGTQTPVRDSTAIDSEQNNAAYSYSDNAKSSSITTIVSAHRGQDNCEFQPPNQGTTTLGHAPQFDHSVSKSQFQNGIPPSEDEVYDIESSDNIHRQSLFLSNTSPLPMQESEIMAANTNLPEISSNDIQFLKESVLANTFTEPDVIEMVDVVTSDDINKKNLKEMMLQAKPDSCDTATDCFNPCGQKSVCAMTYSILRSPSLYSSKPKHGYTIGDYANNQKPYIVTHDVGIQTNLSIESDHRISKSKTKSIPSQYNMDDLYRTTIDLVSSWIHVPPNNNYFFNDVQVYGAFTYTNKTVKVPFLESEGVARNLAQVVDSKFIHHKRKNLKDKVKMSLAETARKKIFSMRKELKITKDNKSKDKNENRLSFTEVETLIRNSEDRLIGNHIEEKILKHTRDKEEPKPDTCNKSSKKLKKKQLNKAIMINKATEYSSLEESSVTLDSSENTRTIKSTTSKLPSWANRISGINPSSSSYELETFNLDGCGMDKEIQVMVVPGIQQNSASNMASPTTKAVSVCTSDHKVSCYTQYSESDIYELSMAYRCRYIGGLVSRHLDRVKETILNHLSNLKRTESVYESESLLSINKVQVSQACTMKPSACEEYGCQTNQFCQTLSPKRWDTVSTVSSETDICSKDHKELKSIYFILAALEGRLRRIKLNLD